MFYVGFKLESGAILCTQWLTWFIINGSLLLGFSNFVLQMSLNFVINLLAVTTLRVA